MSSRFFLSKGEELVTLFGPGGAVVVPLLLAHAEKLCKAQLQEPRRRSGQYGSSEISHNTQQSRWNRAWPTATFLIGKLFETMREGGEVVANTVAASWAS
jgi:hypothetical protein